MGDLLALGKNVIGGLGNNEVKANKTDLTSIFESKTTASQAISVGTYFYLDGVLVRAKTAIASGDTFTEGTNYEVVTAGALNNIDSKLEIDTNTFTGITLSKLSSGRVALAFNYKTPQTGTTVTKVVFASSTIRVDCADGTQKAVALA